MLLLNCYRLACNIKLSEKDHEGLEQFASIPDCVLSILLFVPYDRTRMHAVMRIPKFGKSIFKPNQILRYIDVLIMKNHRYDVVRRMLSVVAKITRFVNEYAKLLHPAPPEIKIAGVLPAVEGDPGLSTSP